MACPGIPSTEVMFDVGPEVERKEEWREEGRN